MSKLKVNLYDSIFAHTFNHVGYYTASNYDMPEKIEWVKNDPSIDISIFTETDLDIAPSVDSKIKIAWLVESMAIHPWIYQKISEIENNFDYIFTHDVELLKRSNKYIQVYVGSSRIEKDDIDKNFEKNKLISMIASNKQMTDGHRFRHEIINNISGVDIWGAKRYFSTKRDPLSNYMYSIAVMNARYNYYFTEILIDCLMYKTIPIFYGCPDIGDIFDLRGMYIFESISDLNKILSKISYSDYKSKLEFININYKIAKNNFMITDDIIADKLRELKIVGQ